MGIDILFGGKYVIIRNEFVKTLPILQKASQAIQFRISINKIIPLGNI